MRSNRRSSRLHVSSHVQVRSTRVLHAWIASWNNRFRPRFVVFRWRGFSVMFGIIPAVKLIFRLCVASNPASRLRSAPLRTKPALWATFFHAFRPSGSSTLSSSFTGATGQGRTSPVWSVMAITFSPCWCLSPESPIPSPPVWPRCWSRRNGARGGRVASRLREGPHWPGTPAGVNHHRPM
jgi:hypothetical protein